MNGGKYFDFIMTFQQLLNSREINKNNINLMKVLTTKIAQLLETIPEFIQYLDEDIINIRHKLIVNFSHYVKYQKWQKGTTIKYMYEGDKFFHMIITGRLLKLNIKYKNLYVSLKEYILYLAKLYILNEKYLFNDCIKKNKVVFPLKENIDIIKFGNKFKCINFNEEFIKIMKMKEEIFFINNEKIKKKININDILLLYNPSVNENLKENFLNNEMKFLVSLPFFYVDKILNPISFLGNLNKMRSIKSYSSFICLNNCNVFYLDKTNIKNENEEIYNIINRKKSEKITNILFKNHYIFKDSDIIFLSKNYSKYIEIINCKKGDFIIHQGSAYEGTFFIINGLFQLKSSRSYNELSDLNYSILKNIKDEKNNKQENTNNFTDKGKSSIINKLIHNQLFIKKSNQKQEINFKTFSDNEIIGLFDIYDKKKGIYNFSVQCISNDAELFFVPKEIFNSLVINQEINNKIVSLIDERNKFLILKIKNVKELFEFEFHKFLSPEKEEKYNNSRNNNKFYKTLFGGSNLRYIDKKSIINQFSVKREKNNNLLENDNYIKLNKSKTSTDISKVRIIPKNYFDYKNNNNTYYNHNNENIHQSKISFHFNNSCIKFHSNNDSFIDFHKQNNINSYNNLLNKNKSNVFSLINNKNGEINTSKKLRKSKTLNNFNENNNINHELKKNNHLIKSSSSECIGHSYENDIVKKRFEEITLLYSNKNNIKNNNDIIIPVIQDIKKIKINFEQNKNNPNFNNEYKYFNILNRKTNNFIEVSPKNNSIIINNDNIKKDILNDNSSTKVISKKNNVKIKKIKLRKLI